MAAASYAKSKDYQQLEELGRGSYGVVHKVKRKHDGKICVCKKVPMKSFDSEKKREQTLGEAKIMKNLDCPYIVEYLEAFVEKDHLYLILQHCPNGDLKRYMAKNNGPLAERTIWRYTLRINLGLEFLHNRRVLHRDIKSENIFLLNEERIRIGDLGLAKVLGDEATGASTVCGTPKYLSPEEVAGSTHYNEKADVWSLGIVVYEMCSDRHRGPFDEATSLQSLFQKISREEPRPLPSKTSEDLKKMSKALLLKDPTQRPSCKGLLELPYVAANAQKHGVTDSGGPTSSGIRNRTRTPPPVMPRVASDQTGDMRNRGDDGVQMPEPNSSLNLRSSDSQPSPESGDLAQPILSSQIELEEVGLCGRICRILGRQPRSAVTSHAGTGLQSGDDTSSSFMNGSADQLGLGPRFHNEEFCEICNMMNKTTKFSNLQGEKRHHCRNCGNSICAEHGTGLRKLRHFGYQKPVRVCDLCALRPLSDTGKGPDAPKVSHMVIAAEQKIYAWDMHVPEVAHWTGGDCMRWVGVTSSSKDGTRYLSALETAPGSFLQLRSLEAPGKLLHSVPLPQAPAPATSSSAAPQGSTKGEKIEALACAGSWIAVQRGISGGNVAVSVGELPSGDLLGHLLSQDSISALALHCNSKTGFVVTGGMDGVVKCWAVLGDGKPCELRSTVKGHRNLIVSISTSILGPLYVCTGSKDSTIRVWCQDANGQGLEANSKLEKVSKFRPSGDGSVCCDDGCLAFVLEPTVGKWEQSAAVWNLVTGVLEHTFHRAGHHVIRVALRGSVLATCGRMGANGSCEIQLWHRPTGTGLSVINNPSQVSQLSIAFIEDKRREGKRP